MVELEIFIHPVENQSQVFSLALRVRDHLAGQLAHVVIDDDSLLFIVTQKGGVTGIITPREVRATERSRWRETQIRQVMRPLDKVRSISAKTPVTKAIELMMREDLNQVPVIADHHIEGMITRSSVFQVLQSRIELGAH